MRLRGGCCPPRCQDRRQAWLPTPTEAKSVEWFPRKTGKDKAPDNGAVKDGGAGLPPPTVPPGDQGVPYLCGSDIPVAKPLHQRASLDNRLVETRHGGVEFQNEGKGTSTCISRLGRGPGSGFAMPTGG